MSEVPYCHLAIRADCTMTHGTSDSTNVFEALWATVDSSNGTHGCDCGLCIFVIFESSSHNRNRSGQRSIYSARSSSSTSRNNNRTKSTWTLGVSLACLRIYIPNFCHEATGPAKQCNHVRSCNCPTVLACNTVAQHPGHDCRGPMSLAAQHPAVPNISSQCCDN